MMESKYIDEYRLKVSDYIKYDILAPHGVLDILQDIAGKHSDTYTNLSFAELLAQNKIWVLMRVKYKVIKNIPLYSKIKVETWPKPKGLVDFDRETKIMDLEGNILIEAISKWVIIDVASRKIIPAKHIEYNVPIPEDSIFNERIDKVKDFDVSNCNSYDVKVEFCDIDHNGHTNNARYAAMLLNALNLKENEVIDEFQIDFIHETMLHDNITIYYHKEDNFYYAKALCNGNIVFLSKIKLK